MITFDQFINTHRGQSGLGLNASDKGECVGLLNIGEVEMRGFTYPLQGAYNAKDLISGNITNTHPEVYEKVINDPSNINQLPSRGDIIVWGSMNHVAYVTNPLASVNHVEVFDQFQGATCQLRVYSYDGCLGWYHIKTVPPVDPHLAQIETLKKQVTDLTLKVTNLTTEKTTLQTKLTEAQTKITVLEKTLSDCETSNDKLQAEVDALKGTANKWTLLKQLIKELLNGS